MIHVILLFVFAAICHGSTVALAKANKEYIKDTAMTYDSTQIFVVQVATTIIAWILTLFFMIKLTHMIFS